MCVPGSEVSSRRTGRGLVASYVGWMFGKVIIFIFDRHITAAGA